MSGSDGSHFWLEALGATVGLMLTMQCPLSLTVTTFEMMAAWVMSDKILEEKTWGIAVDLQCTCGIKHTCVVLSL